MVDDPFAASRYSVELAQNNQPVPRITYTPLSFLRQIFTNIFIILTGAYGIHISLFILLRMTVGEQWKIISFYNNFVHLMLMPALILLPITLLLRRWRISAGMILAVLTFILLYAPNFLPRSNTIAADAETFTVLTYNIHAETHVLDGMITVIREADADIVALQEVSVSAAEILAAQLSDQYPHQVVSTGGNAIQGQALLSRLPIIADESWQNSSTVPMTQRITIEISGQIVTIYNFHAPVPFTTLTTYEPARRRQEIEQLMIRATQDNGMVVLAGDFNMPDQSDDYQQVAEHFVDSYLEAGWGFGFTFPDFRNERSLPRYVDAPTLPLPPLMRIDYVFHTDDIVTVDADVWHTSGGSDHRPIVVNLALNVE